MYVYLPGVLRSREDIYFHLFQIGLLIIDTQGTYGNGHSTAETVSIFTLSNIVSSFQVYNVKESVNEKDWESLQVKTNVTEGSFVKYVTWKGERGIVSCVTALS